MRYGSVVGKVSLPHLYSRQGSPNRPARTRKTPPQPQSPHPSDSQAGISNLRFPRPLHSNRPPSQSQPRLPNLPLVLSPSLRPSVSPLSPTSRSRILLMMSIPSTPRSLILLMMTSLSILLPSSHIRPSTLKMAMWKCYAGTRSSASTPPSCPSTLLPFVGYSLRPAWPRRNHQMVVLVLHPQTPRGISPRS